MESLYRLYCRPQIEGTERYRNDEVQPGAMIEEQVTGRLWCHRASQIIYLLLVVIPTQLKGSSDRIAHEFDNIDERRIAGVQTETKSGINVASVEFEAKPAILAICGHNGISSPFPWSATRQHTQAKYRVSRSQFLPTRLY
jgi:hypothetical protein